MTQNIILIPAFNPDETLIALLRELRALGFLCIIVIDDGSDETHRPVFQEVLRCGCIVAKHDKNRGKGAALKTGFRTAVERFGEGNCYITADADGQHLPEDILAVGRALAEHPDALVLGTRDFGSDNVPWKSRFGNRITSFVFRLMTGVACADTQTGLRGVPACLERLALIEEGERYEYEMNVLLDAAGAVPFYPVPIQTVYRDGNRGSHFHPVRDSARVYGRLLRHLASSLAGAAVDYSLFFLFMRLLPFPRIQGVFLAAVLARIASGMVNYLLARYWTFRSRRTMGREAVRYGCLFIAQMCASSGLVSLFSLFLWPVVAKLIVDSVLFFVSFVIQKNWVFRKEELRWSGMQGTEKIAGH
ncbi:MAG: bifunctional glycosyltransferase family 2/GtrA family protein [Clostridiales bacterium]|nr:bifunctional glycosyltransferase family 2/GtrA family protein [Clostridiales bacterium]